jgi:hypothetical protein
MGEGSNCFNMAVCHGYVDTTQQNRAFDGGQSCSDGKEKFKLILKIKWLHEKYKDKLTEYGEVLTMEELEKLPLTNLLMMETQFSSQKLNKKYDIDLRNGGQGDSQT